MDTSLIQKKVEPAVRKKLAKKYGQPFSSQFLPVGTCSDGSIHKHEFDAVSDDGKIVASIQSSSGTTIPGGNPPDGKIARAFKELYFLSLVRAEKKLLVVTNSEFFNKYLEKKFNGILPPKTIILLLEVSPRLQKELDSFKGKTD